MRTSMTRIEVQPERVGLDWEVDLLLGDLRAALVEVLALAVASDEWDRGHLRALVGRVDELRAGAADPYAPYEEWERRMDRAADSADCHRPAAANGESAACSCAPCRLACWWEDLDAVERGVLYAGMVDQGFAWIDGLRGARSVPPAAGANPSGEASASVAFNQRREE